MRKRVLLTGCAGFVGSNMLSRLLGEGYEVRGIDDFSYGNLNNIRHALGNSKFDFQKGDVKNERLVKKISKGASIIIHMAAYKIPLYESALNTLLVNTHGTEAVLKAALENKCKVVFTSTSDVYGKSNEMPFSEESDLVLGPPRVKRWAYAASKLFDEHLCLAYKESFNLPIVIVRYFNTYGPGHPVTDEKVRCGPQPIFIEAALKDEVITIYGDGSQKRCFSYIDDTIAGTLLALESQKAVGEIFNIGNDKTEISILGLANLIRKLSGVPGEQKIKFIPFNKAFKNFEDVQRRIPDLSKARKILGFRPKVSNEAGLKITIDWQKGVYHK